MGGVGGFSADIGEVGGELVARCGLWLFDVGYGRGGAGTSGLSGKLGRVGGVVEGEGVG